MTFVCREMEVFKTVRKVYFFCSFLFLENGETGGHGTLIRQMASYLLKEGYEVEVVALYGLSDPDALYRTRVLHTWQHSPGWGPVLKMLFWIVAISRLVYFVIFNISDGKTSKFISLTAGASLVLPVFFRRAIIWENVAYMEKRPLIDRIRLSVIRLFKGIVVVPTYVEKCTLDNIRFSPDVRYIKNWYSPNIFESERRKDRHSLKFMLAGMLQKRKGFDLFIEAIRLIRDKIPKSTVFHIYGNGSERETLSQLIQVYGLDDLVQLKGFANNLEGLYKDYDVFILSSRLEGLPLVMLNALASGLPVVAFDCPTGPGSIIKSGQNGTLVPNGDVNALSEAIEHFTVLGGSAKEYSPRCVESVRPYQIDIVMKDWLAILEDE